MTVTKLSFPRQSCMTLLYLSFPRTQVSKACLSCSYHQLITQPACSPPSNTGDFLLMGHQNCWCGKAATRSLPIFCCLLMKFDIWKSEGVPSTTTLTSKKKRRTLRHFNTEHCGTWCLFISWSCFSKGKALWEKSIIYWESEIIQRKWRNAIYLCFFERSEQWRYFF